MTRPANSTYINKMPISIHLPLDLLRRVDARAQRLGLSRSSYIANVLEKDLAASGGWSEGFFERLRALSPEDAAAAAELSVVVQRRRSSRRAPRL